MGVATAIRGAETAGQARQRTVIRVRVHFQNERPVAGPHTEIDPRIIAAVQQSKRLFRQRRGFCKRMCRSQREPGQMEQIRRRVLS